VDVREAPGRPVEYGDTFHGTAAFVFTSDTAFVAAFEVVTSLLESGGGTSFAIVLEEDRGVEGTAWGFCNVITSDFLKGTSLTRSLPPVMLCAKKNVSSNGNGDNVRMLAKWHE